METPEKKGLRETQMLSPVELRGTGGTEGCTWEGFGHAQVAGGGQELGDCNLGVTCRREQVCAERGQLERLQRANMYSWEAQPGAWGNTEHIH